MGQLLVWLVVGVLAWQLLEYLIHRHVFHGQYTSYWGITFHFLLHGNHHKFPKDHERLVFPPVPAAPLVYSVYKACCATLPHGYAYCLFSGALLGYLIYDCLHYVIHHGKALPGPLNRLRRRHFHHHFKDTSHGFGISSIVFDVVFGTLKSR